MQKNGSQNILVNLHYVYLNQEVKMFGTCRLVFDTVISQI